MKKSQIIRYCWYCHLYLPHSKKGILNEYGCCKRCGTNLKKYPTLDSHRPEKCVAFGPVYVGNDEELEYEVLGIREKCNISNDEGEY